MKVDKFKVLKVTYWFLYVALIFVSYIFIGDAWQDYIKDRTDMAHEEQIITKHPSVTVTFLEKYRGNSVDFNDWASSVIHAKKRNAVFI